MREPLIELRGISFEYPGRKRVFQGLDFTLYRGERVGLVGPNGSGKTTLLHLIMGLLRPTEGEIRIFGVPRKKEEDFKDVRRRIGLLFQDSDDQLFCPTVEEDIAFGPLNLRLPREEVQKRVDMTCEALGLEGLKDAVTHRLSGGEKRLVALATVFAMEPECYLLDEPTTGLDPETTERIVSFLRSHAETYLIITHDRELLRRTAQRVCVLQGGRIEEARI